MTTSNNTLLVLGILVACFAAGGLGGRMMVGAPSQADLNDPVVQKLMLLGIQGYNRQSNAFYIYTPSEVAVTQQVVQGIRYTYTGQMKPTKCRKSSSTIDNLNLGTCEHNDSNGSPTCFKFDVWYRVWMPEDKGAIVTFRDCN